MNFVAQASSVDFVGSYLPALLVVFGAPLGLWMWLRRGRTSRPQRLQITEKVALGKNQWAAVLTVDDRRFLVGAGESGLGLLSELEPSPILDEAASEEPTVTIDDTDTSSTYTHTHEQPRTGLVQRLQHMTVRRTQAPRRSFSAARR